MRYLILLATFLLLSSPSAQQADELIERGLLEEAYRYLVDNYKNAPDEPENLFIKGRAEESGEYSASYLKDFINQLTEESSLSDWAHLYLGKYYLSQKLYLSARKQFAEVEAGSTFRDEANYLSARCYLLSGEAAAAADSFQTIIDNYQSDSRSDLGDKEFYAWSLLGLAESWFESGDYPKAAGIYDNIIKGVSSEDVLAPALLGIAELNLKLGNQRGYDEYMQIYKSKFGAQAEKIDQRSQPQKRREPETMESKPSQIAPSILSSGYYIQIGSFKNIDNARRMSSLYRESGYDVSVENFIENGEEFHRVVIGRYTSKQQAEFVKKRLERATGERFFVIGR